MKELNEVTIQLPQVPEKVGDYIDKAKKESPKDPSLVRQKVQMRFLFHSKDFPNEAKWIHEHDKELLVAVMYDYERNNLPMTIQLQLPELRQWLTKMIDHESSHVSTVKELRKYLAVKICFIEDKKARRDYAAKHQMDMEMYAYFVKGLK